MKPESPGENTVLFFDTGFFWKLAGKTTGDAFAAGIKAAAEADDQLKELLSPPWTPWRTPFLFMELIGLTHSQFEKPPPFEIQSPVDESTVIAAFNHYKGHYESCPELQAEAIRKKINEREEWISDVTGHNWVNVIQELGAHDGTPDWLHHALAFDAVHKLDPPLTTRAGFQSTLVAYGFFSEVRWVRNMSKFRLAKRFWDRTWSLLPPESKENLEKESRAMKIKNHADYSDVDLIHLATLGVEAKEGEHHKTVCLTCDDPDDLIMRLRVYRGVLAHVRELYSDHADEHGYPEDYDSHWNGIVLCFNPETGSLVRRIDVQGDAPPLPILGEVGSDDSSTPDETDESHDELRGPAQIMDDAFDSLIEVISRDDGSVYGPTGKRRAAFFDHRRKMGKKWRNPGICAHPSCTEKTVKSHAIQRAGPLHFLSEEEHLLTPCFDHGRAGFGMERIGYGEASTFPGFCATHEQIFSKLEKSGDIQSEDNLGLQVFRSVCREIVRLEHEIAGAQDYLNHYDQKVSEFGRDYVLSQIRESIRIPDDFEITDISVSDASRLREVYTSMLNDRRRSLADLRKNFFQQSFTDATGGADGLAHIMISTNPSISVCLSGIGFFGIEENGKPREILAVLNVWPSSGKTVISLSAPLAHEDALKAYTNSYTTRCLGALSMIETWMIKGTDHWFITPSVWESLPEKRRATLLLDMATEHDISTPYPHSIFDELRSKCLPLVSKDFSPAEVDHEKAKLRDT